VRSFKQQVQRSEIARTAELPPAANLISSAYLCSPSCQADVAAAPPGAAGAGEGRAAVLIDAPYLRRRRHRGGREDVIGSGADAAGRARPVRYRRQRPALPAPPLSAL